VLGALGALLGTKFSFMIFLDMVKRLAAEDDVLAAHCRGEPVG